MQGHPLHVLEAFGRRYLAHHHGGTGRVRRPLRRWPQGLASGQVKQHYKGRGMERVAVRTLSGKARLTHVWALLG